MEERKSPLSACWHNFLACFRRSDQTDNASKRKEKEDTVIANPIAVSLNQDPSSAIGRPLPFLPAKPVGEYYVALYDYSARTANDLSFSSGDTLEALDKRSGDWWLARALTGISASKQGYIPANYVAPVESINAEP